MSEDLLAKDYQPRSELVVPQHLVPRAKFPVVDAHNHVTYPGFGWEELDIPRMLKELDELNVATIVNLSGETGDVLKRNIEAFDRTYPGRFITYCNLDFTGFGTPGWTDRTAKQVLADVQRLRSAELESLRAGVPVARPSHQPGQGDAEFIHR